MTKVKRYILEQVANKKLSKEKATQFLIEMLEGSTQDNTDIAIIGMAARFPKSNTIDEFWKNIRDQINCIDLPSLKRRKIWDEICLRYLGMTNLDNMIYEPGGYIDDIDRFDYDFFSIPETEAIYMDPFQRILLEVAYLAIEDALYSTESLYGTKTGVFIGRDHACESSYAKICGNVDPMVLTGSYPAIISSRISHVFNLKGPSIIIDAACSSALVAVHQACKALRAGECGIALAGGINIKEALSKHDDNPMGRILTDDGAIKTFDRNAKGTLIGEGAGVIVLKPLDKAVSDRDRIYGVIKGSAINNDGASSRISAPTANAQAAVIVEAWENAKIDPETVSYIEAHGTGTILGDPIEIKAMKKAFERYTDKKQFCPIGTVKTNIGHTVAASGMAAVIKTVMAARNKKIPGNINFKEANPYINLTDTPFYISDTLTDWNSGDTARRWGVNSFGFSGTNCHIVFEEYITPEDPIEHTPADVQIFTLSAHNEKSLKDLIKHYKIFLRKTSARLEDICYTSTTGRGHHKIRIVILPRNLEDLKNKLDLLSEHTLGEEKLDGIYYGKFDIVKYYKKNKEVTDITEDQQKKLTNEAASILEQNSFDLTSQITEKIVRLYIKGAGVNWGKLYTGREVKKVSLPLYQLDRKFCWFELKEPEIKEDVPNNNSREKQTQVNAVIKEVVLTGKQAERDYTELEKEVALVWGQVLQISTFNIHDNFYSLGGDSLSAMKIVNILNKKADFVTDITELLRCPTLNSYTESLEQNNGSGRNKLYEGLGPVTEKEGYPAGCFPMSSAQKRMFVLNQLEEDLTSYNMPKAVLIEGKIDLKRCEEVFRSLIKRHEALRTSFYVIGEEPVQEVQESAVFSIDYLDGSECLKKSGEINKKSVDACIKEYLTPFDLSRAPLLKAGIISLSADKNLMIIDMHHIISDGTSMEILIQDFFNLYCGRSIPDITIQYKDFSVWQNDLLTSEQIQMQENYWENIFSGEIPVLKMPLDFQRPSMQSYKGSRWGFSFDKEFSARLTGLASNNDATLFMLLLAVYNILLSKYADQEDIVVGTPIAGRPHRDLENIIGVFVNTLALRNYPEKNKTFIHFLKEVQELTLQAYENQDYQFEKLIEKLNVDRSMNRNPLFDTMFVKQNDGIFETRYDDLDFLMYEYDSKVSKLDMTVYAMETIDDRVELFIEYCTNLFKEDTIKRFVDHYKYLLEQVLKNPHEKIADLKLAGREERNKVIFDFNDTQTDYPQETPLYRMFELNAAKHPSRTAVLYEGKKLTYGQLNEKANRIARVLQEKGVGPQSICCIVAERSFEMMIGIMAIMKAGGAYLPIDPAYPDNRIVYILKDSKPSVIVTQEKFKNKFSQNCKDQESNNPIVFDGEIIDLDDEDNYRLDASNLDVQIKPSDLAYIIYTSGSTGNPKGSMIAHYSLINRLNWMQNEYSLTQDDVILQKTPFTFDVSVWELFWWLIPGGSVCFLKAGGEKDPEEIIDAISTYGITTMHFVPSMLNIFVDYLQNRSPREKLKGLSRVFASGEALIPGHVKKFYETVEGAYLYNLYGPTEATIDVSYFNCIPGKEYKSIPIGKPIDNIALYVLGENNEVQPIGVPGELHIAGAGLALGYLNKPDLTKKKFVDNPFNPGQKMYKTGDLAKWLDDGNLEFLGRIDNQVKIRGLRIELGEIEANIAAYEQIKENAVIIHKDKNGDSNIVAYVVGTKELTISGLRQYLIDNIPEYMVPSRFVILDHIPLTHNGKIDRKALPEPAAKIETDEEYIAPRDETEQMLSNIWCDVLDSSTISIKDNFFHIGGDSFKALRIVSALGGRIKLTDLYSCSTIELLADKLKSNIESENQLLFQLIGDAESTTTLLCVPYGGGNALVYKQLADSLSEKTDNITLYSLDLPGHDYGRPDEEMQTVEQIAANCFKEIQTRITTPVILYGHCVGSALTLEIARLLEENSVPLQAVCIGGAFPIDAEQFREENFNPWTKFTDQEIHGFLQSIGGFSEEIQEQELQFLMRNFRHDSAHAIKYYNKIGQAGLKKMTAPLYCIVADNDSETGDYELRYTSWLNFAEKVKLAVVKGGDHYFLKAESDQLSRIILDIQQTTYSK